MKKNMVTVVIGKEAFEVSSENVTAIKAMLIALGGKAVTAKAPSNAVPKAKNEPSLKDEKQTKLYTLDKRQRTLTIIYDSNDYMTKRAKKAIKNSATKDFGARYDQKKSDWDNLHMCVWVFPDKEHMDGFIEAQKKYERK